MLFHLKSGIIIIEIINCETQFLRYWPYFLNLQVSSIYCIYNMLPEDVTSFCSCNYLQKAGWFSFLGHSETIQLKNILYSITNSLPLEHWIADSLF